MKTIYFVRHGQSKSNADKVRYGADVALTTLGEQQAAAVAERFTSLPIELVISSPYKRAHDTGKAIAQAAGVPIEITELVQERGLPAEVIGKSRHDPEIVKIVDEVTDGWLTGDIKHPTAEDIGSMIERADSLREYIAQKSESHIVIASHNFFTKVFLCRVLLGDLLDAQTFVEMVHKLSMKNTGITRYEVRGGVWKLRQWNDDAHLGELV